MLKQLLGRWYGIGHADYPTIAATKYREELHFRPHAEDDMVQIEQKTWRIHPDNSETLLHWEFGFIQAMDDESYVWNNAQNNGRVEVLQGHITRTADILTLDFTSVAFANDPRMLQATRYLTLANGVLRYQMQMAIQAHPDLHAHLDAELHLKD